MPAKTATKPRRAPRAKSIAGAPTLALREIARALSAAGDLDTTLDLFARKTTEVLGVDFASIYLLDPDGDTLRLRASTGLARAAVGRVTLGPGEGLTGDAVLRGEPVFAREAQADPRFKWIPETHEKSFHSLLAVPLRSQERIIGGLNVQTRRPHNFTPEEIELLSLVGDLAAGALEKAGLYEIDAAATGRTFGAGACEPGRHLAHLPGRYARRGDGNGRTDDECLGVLDLPGGRGRGQPGAALGAQVGAGIPPALAHPAGPGHHRAGGSRGQAHRLARRARRSALSQRRPGPRRRAGRHAVGAADCARPGDWRAELLHSSARDFSDEQIARFSTLANQTALAIENARLVTNAAVVREMHHRIKNNLQTVAMLLRMQASDDRSASPREALAESVNRILSIAAVHEVLSERGFRLVDVKEVIERITRTVGQNMVPPGLAVDLSVAGEPVVLPSRAATALALAVNELLQNALEHAFVGRASGAVRITLARTANEIEVAVADDGVGRRARHSGSGQRRNLGLELVEALVREDLKGRLEFTDGADGTRAVVRLPRDIEQLAVE